MEAPLIDESKPNSNTKMPTAPSCFGRGTVYYGLKAMGLLGAVGCGLYTCFELMWSESNNIQWKIIYVYLTLFSAVIISAECDLMVHPRLKEFSLFITKHIGRSMFYIFMGGVILQEYGYIPGIWLITTGVLNVLALLLCSQALHHPNSQPAAVASSSAASTPSSKPI